MSLNLVCVAFPPLSELSDESSIDVRPFFAVATTTLILGSTCIRSFPVFLLRITNVPLSGDARLTGELSLGAAAWRGLGFGSDAPVRLVQAGSRTYPKTFTTAPRQLLDSP